MGEGGCFDFVCVLGFGVVLVGALCFGLCYLFCCELRSASCFSVLKCCLGLVGCFGLGFVLGFGEVVVFCGFGGLKC